MNKAISGDELSYYSNVKKHNKKKIYLTFIVFLFFSISAQSAENIKVGDLYYEFSGDEAWISNKGKQGWLQYGWYTLSDCNIPETIEYQGATYRVTRINESAFQACDIKTVTIPKTVTRIKESAFAYCRQLQSITIPSSVTTFPAPNSSFSYYAPFYECNSLRTIIYTRTVAPTNWTATTYTYVPDLISYSSPGYSINQAKIIEMISFEKTTFVYSGQSPTTTWKNNVEGYTASLTMPTLKKDVGEYKVNIPVTFTKGEESFTASVVYRYTIKPLKLTAKVNNVSRKYGEDNPQFSIFYAGFLSGESESVITTAPTVSTTATKTSNVGEYPITISGGTAANYEFVYEPGVLTVTKAPLSAMVNDATKVYGAQNPAFTIDYYGLKNGETTPAWTKRPTFQTDATQSSGVGQYVVKAVDGVPVNYDLGEITIGILNITPAQLTIKANNAVRQYYSNDPTFTYKCNGFVNEDDESMLTTTPTLSTTATRLSNVGTYIIKVGETSSPNYSISYVNGTLTITPRTLTASVGNYERVYNEENPTFEVNIDGFVGNDDESVLEIKPKAKTSATKSSDVGTYSINVMEGSADNYTFSYTSGTLTINKAEQVISWEQNLSGLKVLNQVELKAVVSSGLPITYTMDNNNIAEIYSAGGKTYLDCKKEGQLTIRAVQNGNNNYYSSARAYKSASITKGTSTPTSIMDINGDGKVDMVDVTILIDYILGRAQ